MLINIPINGFNFSTLFGLAFFTTYLIKELPLRSVKIDAMYIDAYKLMCIFIIITYTYGYFWGSLTLSSEKDNIYIQISANKIIKGKLVSFLSKGLLIKKVDELNFYNWDEVESYHFIDDEKYTSYIPSIERGMFSELERATKS